MTRLALLAGKLYIAFPNHECCLHWLKLAANSPSPRRRVYLRAR